MREIVFMFFLVIRRKKYLECAWVVTWLRERTPSVISETTSPSFFQVISADGTGGLASLLHVILTSLPFSTFTLTIHRTNWDEDRPRTTRPVPRSSDAELTHQVSMKVYPSTTTASSAGSVVTTGGY